VSRCYDCGAPCVEEVCIECLALADARDYEERCCRSEHGTDCGCWELSEAALACELRKTSPIEHAVQTYAEVCLMPAHAPFKASEKAFAAGTVRLPHYPGREAYQDDGEGGALWCRNCAVCTSTIYLHVASRVAA
jgi:hypothetical protein